MVAVIFIKHCSSGIASNGYSFFFIQLKQFLILVLLLKKLFIGPEAQFVWITLPILTMILMRNKRNKDKD